MNKIQGDPPRLDDADRRILGALALDGRLPYKELSARTGIPVSTCHGRVRALEEAGVIRGYRADIDPVAAGFDVQALITLTVHASQRNRVPELWAVLRAIPGAQNVFLLGGDRDLVLHVACPSVAALKQLIEKHLGSNPAFDQTRTQIVFEHARGADPVA